MSEWAQAEPGRCERRADLESPTYSVVVDVPLDDYKITLTPEIRPHERGYVEAAVQEALDARGWQWEVHGDGDGWVGASVWTDRERPITSESYRVEESAGLALLSAYLGALSRG